MTRDADAGPLRVRRGGDARSAPSTLLHRVVSAPTATHDKDEDLVTYGYRAEPAEFQEMFDRLEISHFNGHYTKVAVLCVEANIPHCTALRRMK